MSSVFDCNFNISSTRTANKNDSISYQNAVRLEEISAMFLTFSNLFLLDQQFSMPEAYQC